MCPFRPLGLIGPSKSHPEVVIQAVAARDRQKAEAFAKANGIPEVKGSYQGWSMIQQSMGTMEPC